MGLLVFVTLRMKDIKINSHKGPNDPLYDQMWYLNPNSQADHMNISSAWRQGNVDIRI